MIKFKNVCSLFFALLVIVQTVSAQENVSFDAEGWKRQNNVIPPSPDAASLGSYGNTGVNYYSGAASINIPLQGIGGKFLSAPLSLSYDASSVKVATVPSWVGLGWTLQAGGVITRAAQGMPDTWNFFDWESEFPDFSGILSPENQLYCNDQIRLRKFYNRVSAGDIDLQPDIFYFNFPGGSGSFIFDKNKNIIQRDRSDLIIEATASGNDFTTFVVTTVNGTKYTFGSTAIERTEYTSDTNDSGDGAQELQPWTNPKHFNFNSSWYLISVTTPGGAESLNYTYLTFNSSDPYSLPINVENDNSISCSQDPETSVWTCTTGAFGNGMPEESNPKIYNRRFLNTITLKVDGYETERTRFIPSYQNVDPVSPATNGMQLNSIIVDRRWELAAWEPVIRYDFNYLPGDPTGRLTLGNLQEVGYTETGSLDASKPPYEFEYYSGALPSFISNAIDFWGYYNGATNNENLSVHKLVPTYSLTGLLLYSGANRRATGDKRGVLKSITYPTGGSTTFEYESHQASNLTDDLIYNFGTEVGGLRLKRMIDNDGLGGIALSRTFNYITENGEESGILMNSPVYAKSSSYTTERPPGVGDTPGSGNTYGIRNNLTLFAYNASSFGTIQGNHIGYSRVEEVIGGIGKNVYHYKVTPNGNGWDPTDGRLLKKEVYGNIAATVQIRDNAPESLSLGRLDREEIYEYGQASPDFNPPTFYVFSVESDEDQDNKTKLCQTVSSSDPCDQANQYEWRHTFGDYSDQPDCLDEHNFSTRFNHRNYGLSTTWTRPLTTTTKDYFYDTVSEDIIHFPAHTEVPSNWYDYFFGNGRSVIQTTDYEYERSDLTLATAISLNNSDGAIHRTEIEYFDDSGYEIRAIPEVITKKVDGSIVGGTRSVLNPRGWTLEIHEILLGGEELLRATVAGYNNAGRPGNYQYMTFPQETFTWTNNLLTERSNGSWIWSYDYNEKRLLENQIDIDGQEVDFEYDPYNRLKKAIGRQGNITKEYDYLYGGPNEVVQTTIYSDAPTQIVNNQFDGLGRPISTLVNGVLKNKIIYDSDGRVAEKTYLPGTFTNLIYESSPLSRLVQEVYPDGNSVKYVYDAEDNAYLNVRINEREFPTQTLTDLLGRQVKMEDAIEGITEYLYDSRGNVETINSPAGSYSYSYDTRSRLISKTVPGALANTYCYDDDTDLMCVSKDGVGNRLSMLYDQYGRETEVYLKEAAGPDTGSGDGRCDCSTSGERIIFNQYDQGGAIYTGKLSSMSAKMIGGSGEVTTSYTLDPFGRVDFQYEEASVDGVTIRSTQDPTLNHADWALTNAHQVTSAQGFGGGYSNVYGYDDFGRVVSHSAHGVSTTMSYNDKDQMIFKVYDAELQRQDYKYNVRGWLTNINTLRPEVLREGDRENGDPEFCEPDTGEDETYVSSEKVPPSEFFELLCEGQNVTIPGLDTCVIVTPPEEVCKKTLYDYTLTYQLSDLINQANKACDQLGEGARPIGYDIFSIEAIYVNTGGSNLFSIPIAYPYVLNTYPDAVEEQRLVDDVSSWLLSIDTLAYPFDSVHVVHPVRGDFSLHITGTDFISFSYAVITGEGPCCKEGTYCTGKGDEENYLGNGEYVVNRYFNKTYNRDEACLVTDPTGGPGVSGGAGLGGGSSNRQYPTTLYEVVLSDNSKVWKYADELASIQGKYTIHKQISVPTANSFFEVTDEAGALHIVTMSGLENLRSTRSGLFEVDLVEEENNNPSPSNCPPTPPGCDAATAEQQQVSLADICAQTIEMFENGTISYPTGISFVQLCDGSYTYVLTDLLGDIYGGYNVLDEYIVESEDDLIGVQVRNEEARFSMQFEHQPNGNIEKMKWKVSNRATSIYDFTYDEIDRVTQADYGEEYYWEEVFNQGMSNEYISRRLIQAPSAIYSTGYSYDGGGNITEIWRNGLGSACLGPGGRIDDMTLTYGGEGGQQLQTVTDAATENLRPFGFKPHDSPGHGSLLYTYDENGNMEYDPHKELDIIYNYLNLPKEANGPNSSFKTVYDATGRKWKKETTIVVEGISQTKTTLYVDGMEFEDTADHPLRLSSINGHEDGRAVPLYDEAVAGDVPTRAEYYHKDHLGNVRLTFSDLNQDGAITVGSIYDPTNEILLEKHYYPFGLEQTGAWFATVAPDNAYRYNGKELDEATGLYDYGARYYDPAIARWGQVDPLAEQYVQYSPYNYVLGNPISLIDPDGMRVSLFDKMEAMGANHGASYEELEQQKESGDSQPEPEYIDFELTVGTDDNRDGFLDGRGSAGKLSDYISSHPGGNFDADWSISTGRVSIDNERDLETHLGKLQSEYEGYTERAWLDWDNKPGETEIGQQFLSVMKSEINRLKQEGVSAGSSVNFQPLNFALIRNVKNVRSYIRAQIPASHRNAFYLKFSIREPKIFRFNFTPTP